jgi:methylated-DNA-[protein]-cysteine S-methyltransferase
VTEVDVVPSPVGPVTIAMRSGKVTALRVGGDRLEGRRTKLPEARRWIGAWFEGRAPSVPLEVEATPFERRVYAVVRRIPRGRTLTYGEVAERAGAPGGARAVGQAMRKNPICLFIPCHRVVGAGRLGGYGGPGGEALKRRLLSAEGVSL